MQGTAIGSTLFSLSVLVEHIGLIVFLLTRMFYYMRSTLLTFPTVPASLDQQTSFILQKCLPAVPLT